MSSVCYSNSHTWQCFVCIIVDATVYVRRLWVRVNMKRHKGARNFSFSSNGFTSKTIPAAVNSAPVAIDCVTDRLACNCNCVYVDRHWIQFLILHNRPSLVEIESDEWMDAVTFGPASSFPLDRNCGGRSFSHNRWIGFVIDSVVILLCEIRLYPTCSTH